MIPLAATNAVGAVLFGALYAVAGARWLPQGAFLGCLCLLFALVTALWVRTEGRQGSGADPVARVGRVALGLVVVIVGVPIVVLGPLFWLETAMPAEAGMGRMLPPAMSLVLISLVLVVLVNAIGGAVIAGRRLVQGPRRTGRPSG